MRDNQDAVVPGALVTVRNIETGATRTLTTEGTGTYRFLNMPVGNYDLVVELQGFSRYQRSGITLSLNQEQSSTSRSSRLVSPSRFRSRGIHLS